MNNSDKDRAEHYKKNETQEQILEIMNQTLHKEELELINKFGKPKLPIIFIIGAQRSGTTVLMQLLSQLFDLSYPNNFIARYWNVPYIGASLYKSLTNNSSENNLDLTSDLGYTKGLEGPHEFSYFWKKWFPWESWEEKNFNKFDYSIIQKQLAAWESINNSPLVFKNLIQIDYNIEKLYSLFPNSIFIYLKRDLKFNIQSTYQSRIKLFNDETKWFGVKPSNYLELVKLPVIEQITKQIISINNDIEDQLSNIPNKNVININYEDLMKDYLNEINKIVSLTSLEKLENNNKIELRSANKISVSDNIFNLISDSVKAFS
jgi:hypothetical protein